MRIHLTTNWTFPLSQARIISPLATIHSLAHLILPSTPVQSHSPSSSPPDPLEAAPHHSRPHSSSSSSTEDSKSHKRQKLIGAMASLSSVATTLPSMAAPAARKKRSGVTYVEGMNAYSGLKGLNKVTMLGVRKSADYSFAKIVASLGPAGGKRRGGTFGAQCNAAGEIFRIAVVMNALVLVGVAVGFVLLRAEAAYEESEE